MIEREILLVVFGSKRPNLAHHELLGGLDPKDAQLLENRPQSNKVIYDRHISQ